MEKKRSRVVIVPCDSYDEEKVYHAMRTGIELLGGIGEFVSPQEKILVKPNFLSAAAPEKAVTTHPAGIKAMLRILSEAGCENVKYGDSPGHGSCAGAAQKIGLTPENTFGAVLADMSEEVCTPFPEGMTAQEFYFAKEVTEADAIISLSKMKTHALERVTGAVKNVYGLICGYRKAAGHVKYPNASIFARMLADIHRCVKPRLHIMDGIVAMEGNGPGSGDPVPMNVLLFSKDPVALDSVFCTMVCLDPELVPTNTQGEAMEIGTYHRSRIELITPAAETGMNTADEKENGAAEAGKSTADEKESGAAETGMSTADEKESGAAEAGMNTADEKQSGESVSFRRLNGAALREEFGNRQFKVERRGTKRTAFVRYSDFMTSLARRPRIDKKLCIRCGVCVEHCPVPGKAVNFKNGRKEPPVYDYKKCIRCYCCQEMCPRHAITAGRRR